MKICPSCGKKYSERSAISRKIWENLGEICPTCGLKEAIEAEQLARKSEEGECYFCAITTKCKDKHGRWACMDCQDVDEGGGHI